MSYLPMIFLAIFLVVMMFMSSRAQKKQKQERNKQLEEMRPGDEIVTIGGLHGLLHEVDKNANTITLDCEGVLLVFEVASIRSINAANTASVNNEEVKQ